MGGELGAANQAAAEARAGMRGGALGKPGDGARAGRRWVSHGHHQSHLAR